jgi:succinate dehydrogenase / fumarate reductase flavoprotein subunit
LGDQDAIEYMCREAPKVVYDLSTWACCLTAIPDGTIYQSVRSVATPPTTAKVDQRACAAADRTGHASAHRHTSNKEKTSFFLLNGWHGPDL